MLKHCIEADIIPDYVCTSESNLKILKFFIREGRSGIHEFEGDLDKLDRHAKDVICIISRKTREEVRDVIESRKFKDVITCNDEEINKSSNIGLFCWKYAWKYLNCDEVVLVGFDHAQAEGWTPRMDPGQNTFVSIKHPIFKTVQIMDPNYQLFREEFIQRAAQTPEIKTINCTEGGSIFGKNIQCMKLSEYLGK